MKNYLQRLGQALLLPVAVLPAAAVLMGIGYWIDPLGLDGASPLSVFLIGAGSALIDHMGILFAVGVALGLSKDADGSAALSGLVAWQIVTVLLAPESVSALQGIPVAKVSAAFAKVDTQFIGILCGIMAAALYNHWHKVELPTAFAFFSGKRLVPIVTAFVMLGVAYILMFLWPLIYDTLVSFGVWISALGAVGAGIFGFFNRLLIPTGLHHALNSVFWFDVAGINDIGSFWSGDGELGMTGRYQAGFFPMMMFGLPGGALALYHTAAPANRKQIAAFLSAVSLASFLTGITTPLEFAFMFTAPSLYMAHSILTGLSLFIAAVFHWTAGFVYSAGLVDFTLSFQLPLANQPYMLLVQGVFFFALYYVVFRFMIVTFDLPTLGRDK